ncbi:MAG: hydroxymethylbilane synthase [Propionicimonas sp.]|nr:hydroxymethylbilane synthase [Propionicimonas sp.]
MIRLGTRASVLARAQASTVGEAIAELTGQPVDLVGVRTEGDGPSAAPPRPGVFVSALRDALLAGTVDVVVHSYKDLPSGEVEGLLVAAVPERANPCDVLFSPLGGLAELPAGARVGTSSPRRAAALRRLRPDLVVVAVRGNVETRLEQARSGEVDAVVVAAAGLQRLGLLDPSVGVLDPALVVPAPAQGALAVECRADDRLITVVGQLDDTASRVAVAAERAVLAGLGASCDTAVGAHASWISERVLLLTADLAGHAGVDYARVSRSATVDDAAAATRLGTTVAGSLLAEPAD